MSKAYVIDKDGIIIKEVTAMGSYHYFGRKVVKPKSDIEDKMLVEYSRLQKNIKALQEEMKELEVQKKREQEYKEVYTQKVEDIFSRLEQQDHETYIPGKVTELMRLWQQRSAVFTSDGYAAEAAQIRRTGLGLLELLQKRKLEHLTAQSAAMARIESLRQEVYELENLELEIETTEGRESLAAEIDQYTNGALTAISKELDAISGRIGTGDPTSVNKDTQLLETIEKKLSTLPELSKRVFAQQVCREEEMERIAQQLEDNGWEILELQRGESFWDECSLFIQGSQGEMAAIRFCLDGKVEIISHFREDIYKTREHLQRLVLESIQESGEKAKGTCLDDLPTEQLASMTESLQEELYPEHPMLQLCKTVSKQEGVTETR